MAASLGEKIGEGAMADIHAWAPGQVVKLFKTAAPRRAAEHEARMTRAVFAAGVPAPEVLGEVTLEGRYGIVLERLDGPTLLQLLRTGAMTPEEAGAVLASVYQSVHRTPAPAGVPSMRTWISAASRWLPEPVAAGVLALIERRPPGEGLCHGDLHAGNVIMTAAGPRLIDWTAAVRAGGAFDLACGHLTLSELLPVGVDPQRPRALDAAVQGEYARLAGLSAAALGEAMEACLPMACAFALTGQAISPAQRRRLIQRVEAALRSGDLI
jgi:Ser/Thr protein kinase RdoA (MazF antagonist)